MSTLTVQNIQGSSSSSNTISVASGHKISGAAGSIVAPGQVIQTVTKSFGDSTTITSYGTTYTDITNGTIQITPKFNNSKILILPNILILISDTSSTYIYFGVRCVRGSDTVVNPGLNLDGNGSYDYGLNSATNGTIQFDTRHCGHHVDEPATTSATTYKFQVINYASGRTTTVNHNATNGSSIIAMEIAQ